MSDNCPKCGFELKDFYTKKIELELKKKFDEKQKQLFGDLNEELEAEKLKPGTTSNVFPSYNTFIFCFSNALYIYSSNLEANLYCLYATLVLLVICLDLFLLLVLIYTDYFFKPNNTFKIIFCVTHVCFVTNIRIKIV